MQPSSPQLVSDDQCSEYDSEYGLRESLRERLHELVIDKALHFDMRFYLFEIEDLAHGTNWNALSEQCLRDFANKAKPHTPVELRGLWCRLQVSVLRAKLIGSLLTTHARSFGHSPVSLDGMKARDVREMRNAAEEAVNDFIENYLEEGL